MLEFMETALVLCQSALIEELTTNQEDRSDITLDGDNIQIESYTTFKSKIKRVVIAIDVMFAHAPDTLRNSAAELYTLLEEHYPEVDLASIRGVYIEVYLVDKHISIHGFNVFGEYRWHCYMNQESYCNAFGLSYQNVMKVVMYARDMNVLEYVT